MRLFAASKPTTFWHFVGSGGLLHSAMSDRTQRSRLRSESRRTYHIDCRPAAQCEANYHRLVRLFPGYEQQPRCAFEVGDAVVELEVTAQDRYTTDMRLRYQGSAIQMGSKSCLDCAYTMTRGWLRWCIVVPRDASRRATAIESRNAATRRKVPAESLCCGVDGVCLTNGRSTNASLTDSDPAGS